MHTPATVALATAATEVIHRGARLVHYGDCRRHRRAHGLPLPSPYRFRQESSRFHFPSLLPHQQQTRAAAVAAVIAASSTTPAASVTTAPAQVDCCVARAPTS